MNESPGLTILTFDDEATVRESIAAQTNAKWRVLCTVTVSSHRIKTLFSSGSFFFVRESRYFRQALNLVVES